MLHVPQLTIDDHPSKWESRFYEAPAGVDVEAYQEKLNAITGLAPDGSPILKLEWGGSASQRVYIEWDVTGNPVRSQECPKYHFLRPNKLTQVADQIPICRWIISERAEPEQYRADDDSDIYFEEGGVKKKRIEKERHGHYAPLVIIGDHAKCPKDCSDKKMCYGDYKAPSDAELGWVIETTYKLHADKHRLDPRKAISNDYMEQVERKVNKAHREQADKALQQHIQEFADDYYKTHGHRFTQDRESHGKYGILPKDIKPNIRKDINESDSKHKSTD